MRVTLAFGRQGLAVDLPDGPEYRVLEAVRMPPVSDQRAAVEQALDAPLAGPPLSQLARGRKSAAISVCDITRPAPNAIVLPPLLDRLLAAGIPPGEIRILIATGLHRGATESEIRHIVGDDVARRFPILNHNARDPAQHCHLGSTRAGTPVWVDQRFVSAGLHITLGFIEPHLMLGFSGGRKLIAPGLAAEASIKVLHGSRFMRDPRAREGCIDDNPLHAELLEIAAMARHDFMLDVSLNASRHIAAVFAGEPPHAHAAGVRWVRQALLQELDRPADAVITTGAGHPLDLTFYQCLKGVTAASQVVRQGGRMLLFGACEEGCGAPEFSQMVERHRSAEDFMTAIEGAPVTVDQWQLEKLALAARKAGISYYVPGLPPQYLPSLWGRAHDDPQAAVAALLADLPRGGLVAVIPDGPYVLGGVQPARTQ